MREIRICCGEKLITKWLELLHCKAASEEAIKDLDHSLVMKKDCLGDQHLSVADTRLYIGRTYHYLGYKNQDPERLCKAGEQFQRALDIFKKAGGEQHLGVAQTHLKIGFLPTV